MTKVDITTAGHTIIIEADEPLDTVAARALDLWRQTQFGTGPHGTTSGQYETNSDTYADEHDTTLGFGLGVR